MRSTIIEFVKFGIVGLSNVIVHFSIYYLLLLLGLHYILSYIVAFIASVLNAYLWNNRFVFCNMANRGGNAIKRIIKVYVSYTTTLLLSIILLFILVDLIHISDKMAPIISVIVTTPINYLMNKLWAFRN